MLLDVDGVLAAQVGTDRDGVVAAHVPEAVVARVRLLADAGRVVWATSWNAAVRGALADALGLPAGTSSIAIRPAPDATLAKRDAIERWLRLHEPEGGWTSAVWLDDAVRDRERIWAAESALPLHVVRIDPALQLTDADVAEALRLLGPSA